MNQEWTWNGLAMDLDCVFVFNVISRESVFLLLCNLKSFSLGKEKVARSDG